jgi:hypothetical protein
MKSNIGRNEEKGNEQKGKNEGNKLKRDNNRRAYNQNKKEGEADNATIFASFKI